MRLVWSLSMTLCVCGMAPEPAKADAMSARRAHLFDRAERSEAFGHRPPCLSATVDCPAERRALPNGVADIEPRAALDHKPNHPLMTAGDGLMQRGRVWMVAFRIVSIGIHASRQQQADNLRMSLLRGQRERPVARFSVGSRQQARGVIDKAEPGGVRQLDASSTF